jgi:hypothetical protein
MVSVISARPLVLSLTKTVIWFVCFNKEVISPLLIFRPVASSECFKSRELIFARNHFHGRFHGHNIRPNAYKKRSFLFYIWNFLLLVFIGRVLGGKNARYWAIALQTSGFLGKKNQKYFFGPSKRIILKWFLGVFWEKVR